MRHTRQLGIHLIKILPGINLRHISGKKLRGDYPNCIIMSYKNKESQSIHLMIVKKPINYLRLLKNSLYSY